MADVPSGELPPCLLRRLTLCDGQVLEEDPGALTRCLCQVYGEAERASLSLIAEQALAELRWLKRRALTKPF